MFHDFRLPSAARCPLPVVCGLLLLLTGCPEPGQTVDESAEQLPLEGVKLRLLVVDDAELAAAVKKVCGEWKAQTGSELEVAEATQQDLAQMKSIDADALIAASYLLGPLAEAELIQPISKNVLREDETEWAQNFELARSREAAWGRSTFAVPFGSPVLTCYYRVDLLKKLNRRPPRTWGEYEQLVRLLSDREKLGKLAPPEGEPWHGTLEPLGPGWAGLVLLARAASSAKHPDNYSTLFDIETMAPLVNSPPMVNALIELVAAARTGPKEQLTYGPTEVRNAFWQGRCGLALTWPTAAVKLPDDAKKDLALGIAALPGSKRGYNIDEREWETRDADQESQVPLLATTGRLGMIGHGSDNPDAAAALLLWLSGGELNPPPSCQSRSTTLFRRSHLKFPQIWVEKAMKPTAAGEYADLTAATFEREQWLFAPRIPGRAEYLAALDDAVHAAIAGKKSPAAALRATTLRWHQITKQLGLEQQRQAYLHSLGLEP